MAEESVIKEVQSSEGYYSIITADGWGFGLAKKYGVEPKVGDTVKTYGEWGSVIRGVDLNGKTVFYKSNAQLEEERTQWLDDYRRQQQEDFERNKSKLDADYAALPDAFKKRIDRFRNDDPNFRVESEAYEMFCCVEAVKIANACGTPERVKSFADGTLMPTEKVTSDEHTGNTFGGACRLAYAYLMGQKL